MDDDVRAFVTHLGEKALARDWAGVHEMLAPWLRAKLTVDDVRAFFENEYRSVLADSGIDELHHPAHGEPDVGGNSHTNATALREPLSWKPDYLRDVPPEVTDANMRYWARMQLQCSDEQMESFGVDFLAEVWMAVVATDEGLRVGYWSQGAY